MTYTEIKKIHKQLQNTIKKEKTEYNKVFIRHWNVFYNQLRGRDISLIEQTSNTPLYTEFIKEISSLFKLTPEPIETYYSKKEKYYTWYSSRSSLFEYIKKEVSDD